MFQVLGLSCIHSKKISSYVQLHVYININILYILGFRFAMYIQGKPKHMCSYIYTDISILYLLGFRFGVQTFHKTPTYVQLHIYINTYYMFQVLGLSCTYYMFQVLGLSCRYSTKTPIYVQLHIYIDTLTRRGRPRC